jgi:hypothetical protein
MIPNDILINLYLSVYKNKAWFNDLCDKGTLTKEQLDVLIDYDTVSSEELTASYDNDKKVKTKIFEFIEEVNREESDWCSDCRMRYLLSRQSELQSIIFEILKTYSTQRTDGTTQEEREFQFVLANVDKYKEKLRRIDNEIRFLKNKQEYSSISKEQIERAKQYPIEDLVKVNHNGFALCINHSDRTPSMFCKNGFAYCFVCNFNGDAIDIYRKVYNKSFIEAVQFLSK